MSETTRQLWTTKAIAEAAGVSRRTIFRIVARFPEQFRSATLRRNGVHPRRHRVFDQAEAQFIFQALTAGSKLCP